MRLHYFLIFPLIILTSVWMARTNSTEDSDYWVYEFHEGETAYEITRTDARTNSTELITTVPYIADFTLASIMPAEELAAAESFVASHSILTDEEPSAEETYTFFSGTAIAVLTRIVPSPDNQTIAMVISYPKCTVYPRMECFGVIQIVLYSIASDEQRVLWATPIQAQTTFFPSDETYPYVYSAGSPEVYISNFRWTANQEAIVAQLEYNIYQNCDSPLVLIPLDTPENAFVLGNGDIAWTIAPNSQEIVAVHKDCAAYPYNMASVITFDNDLSLVSRLSYPLPAFENAVVSFATISGAAYFQNRGIFQIYLQPRGDVGGDFHRLAVIEPETGEISLIENLPTNIYKGIQASPSSQRLVLLDDDGYVWQLIASGDDFTLEAVTDMPVAYWQFANDNELIVQFAGDNIYSVVNIAR